MLEMTQGELFIVVFVVLAVVSAPWWASAGGALGRWFAKRHHGKENADLG
jgi:hypothetical protein